LCAKKGIAIHSDLTQAIGKMAIDVHDLGIDFASCSAHKIYGPKGVGAAFVKSDAYGIPPITAFMHGGEQENGFRAGTLAVHNIVGFGKAAEIALRDLAANETRIINLDKMFVAGMTEIADISLTNKSDNRLPGIISIVVDKKDFNNERFIKRVSDRFALSTGSACSAGEPSYVITALGLEDKVSKVLRITLNKFTREEEIVELLSILKEI
jgi:cysteine desulfurase